MFGWWRSTGWACGHKPASPVLPLEGAGRTRFLLFCSIYLFRFQLQLLRMDLPLPPFAQWFEARGRNIATEPFDTVG